MPLLGKPLIAWTLQEVSACAAVDHVVLVGRSDQLERLRRLADDHAPGKVTDVVQGGTERLDSVRAGVAALPPETTHVVVHDGARPLCSPDLFQRVIAAAQECGAAIAAVPATDTTKLATSEGCVERTLERGRLWCAQTPQAFERRLFERACGQAEAVDVAMTDDAMLVERLGHPVRLVEGAPTNLKVTRPTDFIIAEALLRQRQEDAE